MRRRRLRRGSSPSRWLPSRPRRSRCKGSSPLRYEVAARPDDRTKRVALVRGLLRAKDLDGALVEARAWRAKDAYNLVAVRALGDVYMERGEKEEAERVYSAIVELLPRDLDAQRALATILKQRGDLPAAEERLLAAVSARPDDPRLLLELADVEQRIGKRQPAGELLGKVVAGTETSEQIRYPAKLRLAQIYRKTPDGTYEIVVRITHHDGGVEILRLPYTVDTPRPNLDVTVSARKGGYEIRAKQRLSEAKIEAQAPGLETIAERRERFASVLTDAKRVEVRTPDGQVLSLTHVRLGEFVGQWRPTGAWDHTTKLRVVAVDRALNENVIEVPVR